MPPLLRQLLTFGAVGGAVYGIDYALFAAVLVLAPAVWPGALPPAVLLAANASGRLGGAAAGYLLHGRYTFPGEHRHANAAPRYAALFLANLGASSLLLLGAAHWLALVPLAARLAVDALVIAGSFLASRAWVFARA